MKLVEDNEEKESEEKLLDELTKAKERAAKQAPDDEYAEPPPGPGNPANNKTFNPDAKEMSSKKCEYCGKTFFFDDKDFVEHQEFCKEDTKI